MTVISCLIHFSNVAHKFVSATLLTTLLLETLIFGIKKLSYDNYHSLHKIYSFDRSMQELTNITTSLDSYAVIQILFGEYFSMLYPQFKVYL